MIHPAGCRRRNRPRERTREACRTQESAEAFRRHEHSAQLSALVLWNDIGTCHRQCELILLYARERGGGQGYKEGSWWGTDSTVCRGPDACRFSSAEIGADDSTLGVYQGAPNESQWETVRGSIDRSEIADTRYDTTLKTSTREARKIPLHFSACDL